MPKKILTTREQEIALLICKGMTNKEIASQLGVCEGTVKLHVHSIFPKLGVKNRMGILLCGAIVTSSYGETPDPVRWSP
jgi:DNA-binding NarL/FixJ family response regulator